jgi:2-hydroxychromene-2-carboxylate isomerase
VNVGRAVDFFFDLSSPYSYLASTQIGAIAARTQAEVHWRPVVLAAVFKAAENTMPAHSPPKARYMLVDLQRWAERYGVPFHFTSRFPLNAMKAHRMIVAAEAAHGPAAAAALGRRFFDALWIDDVDLGDAAQLTRLADEAGLPGAALLSATESQLVKDRLRANTDEAIARGMFGAPALFVGDELFWGNDRLEFLEAALKRTA